MWQDDLLSALYVTFLSTFLHWTSCASFGVHVSFEIQIMSLKDNKSATYMNVIVCFLGPNRYKNLLHASVTIAYVHCAAKSFLRKINKNIQGLRLGWKQHKNTMETSQVLTKSFDFIKNC